MTGLALAYLDASYQWALHPDGGLAYTAAITTIVGAIIGSAR